MKQLRQLIAAATLLALPCGTRAAADADTLRCEALRLRKEARRIECTVRCERRAQQQLSEDDVLATVPETMARLLARMSLCQELCDNRYAASMQRLAGSAACADSQGDSGPDTRLCQALLLRVEARQLSCQSHCLARASLGTGFDEDACREGCDEAHEIQLSDALAKPVCADAGGTES